MLALLKFTLSRNGLMLLLGMLPFTGAWAACTAASQNVTMNIARTISVAVDAPVGTELVMGAAQITITCTSSDEWSLYLSPSNPDFGPAPVDSTRATNYSGIGIKWENYNPLTATWSTVSNNALNASFTTWNRGIGTATITDKFTLIKTGPVLSGNLALPSLSFNIRSNVTGVDYGLLATYNFPAIDVVGQSCIVETPSVNVPLGSVPQSTFRGVGSTSASVPFAIGLRCVSGTKVNVEVIATAIPSQAGTIQLSPDTGAASGIGVQMLDGQNNPLTLNSSFLVGTTTSDGPYTINWQARYIQTSTAVTPGVANASATFTMTYL